MLAKEMHILMPNATLPHILSMSTWIPVTCSFLSVADGKKDSVIHCNVSCFKLCQIALTAVVKLTNY